jgi:hypothetical protein
VSNSVVCQFVHKYKILSSKTIYLSGFEFVLFSWWSPVIHSQITARHGILSELGTLVGDADHLYVLVLVTDPGS